LFDPTAFENMKVVIEGYLYDKDLDGELRIIDRNDVINLSKLSREYIIQFQLRNSSKAHHASFRLIAGLDNLAAELLPENIIANRQGCVVELQFNVIHPNDMKFFEKIQREFQRIWGEQRGIEQNVNINPLNLHESVQNRISIEFNRLISEDQMDDLLDMIDHMAETLEWLESV
jgi:hypothetical protein